MCHCLTKKTKMKKEDKIELLKLIYKIDNAGEFNSMIRRYFDINTKKEWKEFIRKYIKLLNN